jgi:uncharacterized protein YbjQ (UPF0145 family)
MQAGEASMMVVTVAAIEGRPVQWYLGVVSGEAVTGSGRVAGVMGCPGEDGSCRESARAIDLRDARDTAIFEMLREAAERGANAVIGVGLGYESIQVSSGANALMVTASGTAVRV